jgi:hypothetical protein
MATIGVRSTAARITQTRLTDTLRSHSSFFRAASKEPARPPHAALQRMCRSSHLRRAFHASSASRREKAPSEPPPTDFNELNVLGNTPAPSTSIDVCTYDGFGLNSGVTMTGGNGALLVNGEAFEWRPWEAVGELRLVNQKGQFEIPPETLGLFDTIWPRPGTLHVPITINRLHL